MKVLNHDYPFRKEPELFESLLMLDDKEILELGCGAAGFTRMISQQGRNRKLIATEVDKIQHSKNLEIDDLANTDFVLAGAEAIPCADESIDVVLMFKSLHHVPLSELATAMTEINRVLKPGGLVYISEPVFAGEFNEILRLFHDEELVRAAAYNAIQNAQAEGLLEAVDEIRFGSRVQFDSFAQFESLLINATHTDMKIDETTKQTVREQFETHLGPEGAIFIMPMRVNLLKKPILVLN